MLSKDHMSAAVGVMRLPFLPLSIVSILLGITVSYVAIGQIHIWHAVLIIIGAVTAHISVNAFNEYHDFHSGLDALTVKTPMSGGSGALPAYPKGAPTALGIATLALLVTCAIGGYFLYATGLVVLVVGIVGVLIIVTYTPVLTRHPVLCLLAPGLAFGPLMVLGTHAVLTGHYSWMALLTSFVPFFLVNNLLLINQYPDVEADRASGRKHLHITWGFLVKPVFAAFLVMTYLVIILAVITGYLPPLCLLALLTVTIAIPVLHGIYRYSAQTTRLIPYLGLNVVLTMLTPLLLCVGLLASVNARSSFDDQTSQNVFAHSLGCKVQHSLAVCDRTAQDDLLEVGHGLSE